MKTKVNKTTQIWNRINRSQFSKYSISFFASPKVKSLTNTISVEKIIRNGLKIAGANPLDGKTIKVYYSFMEDDKAYIVLREINPSTKAPGFPIYESINKTKHHCKEIRSLIMIPCNQHYKVLTVNEYLDLRDLTTLTDEETTALTNTLRDIIDYKKKMKLPKAPLYRQKGRKNTYITM